MAPKTRSSSAGKVVVKTTTKKIVEETVQQVVVSPSDDKGLPETIVSHESSVKENDEKLVEVILSPSKQRQPVKKPIVVEDKTAEEEAEDNKQETQSPEGVIETISSPSSSSEGKRRRRFKATEGENHGPKTGSEVRISKHKEQQRAEEEEEDNKNKRKGKSGKGNKRRKKNDYAEYKRYVYMVMKQVHPDMGISSKAMTVINNLISDMFERIAEEASKLSKYVGIATMSFLEIQDAVKLVLPGDLGKHAIAEGSKAVNKYAATISTARENSKYRANSKKN